uniref:NADH-ubiquinone oxidoreductase chain 2 n=1 Tax=Lycostomus sp. YXY-2021 TaxID=2806917 RepID=A0A888YNT9_9COLE|nr:NADH dehydrogenase subunit 2 [Lycostomus sp. YXY-2021]
MNKNYKILFMSSLFIGSIISISSYSWFGMWIGLEINLLSIIPLMQEKINMMSTESSIKYFITQAMASSILIMAIIIMMMNTGMSATVENSSMMLMLNSSLLTKMGMAPFHFWFPEVMEGLSWMNCLIMMTWQKLAPMVLVMYNMIFPMFTEIIIIMGMIISGISSFNQISMRKLLTYSSINHMSWMLSSMMIFQTIWLIYFIVYTLLTINITWVLNKKKISLINQMYTSMNNNSQMKMLFILNFLNLSGLPPFLGFLPKWMTIQALINNNMIFLAMSMVILTLIMVFIYMKISITSLILNTNQENWNLKTVKNKSFKLSMFNFINLSTLMVMTLIFSNI